MESVAIIAFTRAGCLLARKLERGLAESPICEGALFSVVGPGRLAGDLGVDAFESVGSWTAGHFGSDDALVFVGATGIAVRAIAPHARDKFRDPAVVCVDEAGAFAVPLLSGHVGGANELARAVARMTGGQAVVSTATDVNGLFAVDEWAARHGLAVVERDLAKDISAALLEGRPVGFRSYCEGEWDVPDCMMGTEGDLGFAVSLGESVRPFERTLHLVPRVATVGVGCRRMIARETLERAIDEALSAAGISRHAVRAIASIDVKADEPALRDLAAARGWDMLFYSADELAAVPGTFASSDFVERTVGVGNVCERAACAGGSKLAAGRRAREGATVAIACDGNMRPEAVVPKCQGSAPVAEVRRCASDGAGALPASAPVPAPRLVVAAPASGCGKTTLACGLMRVLARRGLRVRACKCGPDYIDPMFHRQVVGAPSRNLDLFFMEGDQVRDLVADEARGADVVVVEAAMGYYDGIAMSDEASAWDVARAIDAPAVIVVDGRGRARSIAAEVAGFARFRNPSHVAGVVVNRCSPALFPRLKKVVERECGVRVFGYVPTLDDGGLESRHLGLVPAAEVADLRAKLERIADELEQTLDIDALMACARSAPALAGRQPRPVTARAARATIAVARDDAFCFYYDDTLALLERLGARLVEFSPLEDAALPSGASGLYLGGGYPELHAARLSANAPLRAEIRAAIEAGMPTVAECGGFMYLHETVEDESGCTWPMVGAVPGNSFPTGRLGRFGYVSLTARDDNLLCAAGESLPAHEFHYWDSQDAGGAFHAQKPQSGRSWECVHATTTLYAGYPHLCLHAVPAAASRFVEACRRWARLSEPGAEGSDAALRSGGRKGRAES